MNRHYIESRQKIEQDLDKALGKPKLIRHYYEGDADLKVIGWDDFCFQVINIEKMGKLYGCRIGPFCFYVRYKAYEQSINE